VGNFRADVFMRLAMAEQTFGHDNAAVRDAVPFAGGLAVMGMWTAN
jgi:hypothetical protein